MQGFCLFFFEIGYIFFPVRAEFERTGKIVFTRTIKVSHTLRTRFGCKIKANSSLIQVFEHFVFRAFHSLNLSKP